MNKHSIGKKIYSNNYKRILRVMRITVFFFFFGIMFSHAVTSHSQETELSLHLKSTTIKEVCKEIEKQTGLVFVFADNVEKALVKKVNIRANSKSINNILDDLLSNIGLKYKILDKQVVVYREEKKDDGLEIRNIIMEEEVRQQKKTITGRITDNNGESIIGANIVEKGTSNGTITDIDGNFSLQVEENAVLNVTYIGYLPQEINTVERTSLNIILLEDTQSLEELVVVGYGTQKKETLVGAITQTKREDLEKSGGVSNLAQALTGRLPGVVTIQSSGMPGENDPEIFIRGQSTWNNNQPLILVDGIERRMNDIDFREVESISVLKDASATAVFGVKGAEGVILINTRRGESGKAQISVSANRSISFVSRMPKKLESYESFLYQNRAIEYELPARDLSWQYYQPEDVISRYRQPQAPGDQYIYPNVDWLDAMTRDFAVSNRVNLNVSGGTNFAKYFGSFSYTREGDLLNSGIDTGADYKAKFGYDRFNFRTNLDFNITSSTTLSVNLAGHLGIRQSTRTPYEFDLWRAFYDLPPSVFPVMHEDGAWGYTTLAQTTNPVQLLNVQGINKTSRTQVTTDFILKQQLDFITQGLSLQGSLSYDNELYSRSGLGGTGGLAKHIAPDGIISYNPPKGVNEFDYVFRPSLKDPEHIRNDYELAQSYRRLFYQIQVNYARMFGLHDVGFTALMNREEYAMGSMFPRYREDWVSRLTYNYDGRYLFDVNGAYNGSERFGKGYRFGFFPSLGVGWLVTNEQFMEPVKWLNKLKVRYSIGKIGSDSFTSPRWAYQTNWGIDPGGNTFFGHPSPVQSPFAQYTETVVGNPFLQWEVAVKQNIGLELGLLNNLFNVNLDLFREDRDKIFMSSDMRNIPHYFGAAPVAANLGETESYGYELELLFRKTTQQGLTYYGSYSLTHVKDKVLYREDPESMPWHTKQAGFQIGQTKTNIANGFINNWDDAYAVPKGEANINYRLPGDAIILDYNGDGIINSFDSAPFGFPSNPQYTYNFMLGADYKGFGIMAQFYGIFNTTRTLSFSDSGGFYPKIFEYSASDYWTPDHLDARWAAPRISSSSNVGSLSFIDGSFLRLKTVEISYTLDKRWIEFLRLQSLKLYVNGNNLFFWSDLPEDRERTIGGTGNLYPTMRRINFGFTADF